jgi:branched-chain amino acid transport system ATP-binding protein
VIDQPGGRWLLPRSRTEKSRARGLAILLVEQNLRTVLAVADRHHVMSKGEICFAGSSAELAGNDFVLQSYFSV